MHRDIILEIKDGNTIISSFNISTDFSDDKIEQIFSNLLRKLKINKLGVEDKEAHSKNIQTNFGKKYVLLSNFLVSQVNGSITLSFEEIETILNLSLPATAKGKQFRSWWSNTSRHSQGFAWISVGWKVHSVEINDQMVVFKRFSS